MPKGRRRKSVGWWCSHEPFDQLMVMVCATLIAPSVIVLCIWLSVFVLFSFVTQWLGLR